MQDKHIFLALFKRGANGFLHDAWKPKAISPCCALHCGDVEVSHDLGNSVIGVVSTRDFSGANTP